MKVLTRYILREYIILLLLTTGALVSIYLVIDVFEKVDNLIEHGADLWIISKYFALEIPAVLAQMLPFSILIASILVMSLLSRSRETMAIRAMGLSPSTLAVPVILSTLLLSLVSLFFNEYVVTQTKRELDRMKRIWVKGESREAVFKYFKVWLKDGRRIYNIRLVEPEKGKVKGLVIFDLEDGGLATKMDVKEARWEGGEWLGKGVKIIRFKEEGIEVKEVPEMVIPLRERPEDLRNLKASADTMDIFELKGYIDRIEEEGYNPYTYRVDLYNKVAIPLGMVIMAFLGVSFGLLEIRGGIPLSLLLSIGLAFSYWLVHAFSTTLGYAGALPPLLASWLPNLAFGALGGFLFLQTLRG